MRWGLQLYSAAFEGCKARLINGVSLRCAVATFGHVRLSTLPQVILARLDLLVSKPRRRALRKFGALRCGNFRSRTPNVRSLKLSSRALTYLFLSRPTGNVVRGVFLRFAPRGCLATRDCKRYAPLALLGRYDKKVQSCGSDLGGGLKKGRCDEGAEPFRSL